MTVKALFLISIQALLYKVIFTQCIGPSLGPSFGPIGAPCVGRVVGANLVVDTSPPDSVSIYSDDLLINGAVYVQGKLPFTGTVALEGALPATGISVVSYECGTGNIGITEVPASNLAILPLGGPRVPGLL